MEVEDRARLKKMQQEADERCQKEAEEEDETLDDTTLWLMDMVTQSSARKIFFMSLNLRWEYAPKQQDEKQRLLKLN